MIHFITMALGGEGYLNFMGNEVRIHRQLFIIWKIKKYIFFYSLMIY